MPQGTCAVSDCGYEGRLKAGLCPACYVWKLNNPGKDPAGRKRHRRSDGRCSVTEGGARCPSPHHANGMCRDHADRARRHGDPLARPLPLPYGAVRAALEAAARATTDECIDLAHQAGRPAVTYNGQHMPAARAVWTIAHGDPGDAQVLHTCHRGAEGCITIRHLYLGDHDRNMVDREEAGRTARGEGHGCAVLTEVQVRRIRERYAAREGSRRTLAAEYSVSPSTIREIVRGGTWKHLT